MLTISKGIEEDTHQDDNNIIESPLGKSCNDVIETKVWKIPWAIHFAKVSKKILENGTENSILRHTRGVTKDKIIRHHLIQRRIDLLGILRKHWSYWEALK